MPNDLVELYEQIRESIIQEQRNKIKEAKARLRAHTKEGKRRTDHPHQSFAKLTQDVVAPGRQGVGSGTIHRRFCTPSTGAHCRGGRVSGTDGVFRPMEESQALTLPGYKELPGYESWTRINRNQLASNIGCSLFFRDKEGEIVHVNTHFSQQLEMERKKQLPWERAEGHIEDECLRRVVASQGWSEELLCGLAGVPWLEGAGAEAIRQRLQHLRVGPPPVPREMMSLDQVFQMRAADLCTRCFRRHCNLHTPESTLPPINATASLDKRPPAPTKTCSASCYLLADPSSPFYMAGVSNRRSPAVCGVEGGSTAAAAEQLPQPEEDSTRRRKAKEDKDEEREGSGDEVETGEGQVGGALDRVFMAWSPLQQDMFLQCLLEYGQDPCSISAFFPQTCQEVHALLQAALPALQQRARALLPAARPQKPPAAGMKKLTHEVLTKRQQLLKQRPMLKRYTPCGCQGPCQRGTCPCFQAGHFCEKFCACYSNMHARGACPFVGGCTCPKGCSLRACPCRLAQRECDPDLCTSCRPHAALLPVTGITPCSNMSLRLGRRKKTAIRPSTIPAAGFGCFILEEAQPGELVDEYIADLFPYQEAERRGTAFDLNQKSYLFDLNRDQTLDAMENGNKMKFTNHSEQGNLEAKVLLVDGDHRLALFAKERLVPGTELFYNYGYTKEAAENNYQWAHSNKDPPGRDTPSPSPAGPGGRSSLGPAGGKAARSKKQHAAGARPPRPPQPPPSPGAAGEQ